MDELSLHLLDVIQNSLEAGATRIRVRIEEHPTQDVLRMQVDDNGRGMPEAMRREVTNPFFTTRQTRAIGLGLPLLEAAAAASGGKLEIESEPGRGTCVNVSFQYGHIDRMPLGDIVKTLTVLVLMTEGCEFEYTHQVEERLFTFNTQVLREELGSAHFSTPEVRRWLYAFVEEGETWVQEGKHDA